MENWFCPFHKLVKEATVSISCLRQLRIGSVLRYFSKSSRCWLGVYPTPKTPEPNPGSFCLRSHVLNFIPQRNKVTVRWSTAGMILTLVFGHHFWRQTRTCCGLLPASRKDSNSKTFLRETTCGWPGDKDGWGLVPTRISSAFLKWCSWTHFSQSTVQSRVTF